MLSNKIESLRPGDLLTLTSVLYWYDDFEYDDIEERFMIFLQHVGEWDAEFSLDASTQTEFGHINSIRIRVLIEGKPYCIRAHPDQMKIMK
jgi:hypothetical protein